MRLSILTILFFLSIYANSQLAYPYKVYSENEKYFIKSIPFSDQVYTEIGKTSVYKTIDSLNPIYTVKRYFQPDFLFLSNDGNSVCFILNWFSSEEQNSSDVIQFYHKGVLSEKYSAKDFIDTSVFSNEYNLLYYNIDIDTLIESDGMLKKIGYKIGTDSLSAYYNSYNAFLKNDTLFLLTQNQFVNKFDLNTGKVVEKISFEDFSKNKLYYPSKRRIINYEIKIPTQFGLPKLFSGHDYCKELAKPLKMVYDETVDDSKEVYKYYWLEIYCGIDSTGKCVDLQIDCQDSILQNAVVVFFNTAKFDKNEIPKGIEKWYFSHIASFRGKSKRLAKKERTLELIEENIERQKLIAADTINGVYIPQDLNDCFSQLNKILHKTAIQKFKDSPENEVIGAYHFGLGLWLRNNWGLWSASRLSEYFNKMEIWHPDDMSGLIILSYHRFLNNKDIEFDNQIKEYKNFWKEQNKR